MRDAQAPPVVTDHLGWGRVFALATMTGVAAFLAGGGLQAALYETRAMQAAQLSTSVCGGVLLLASRRPLEAAARAIAGPRGAVTAWLAMSVGAVVLGLTVLADLHHALQASWRFTYGDPKLWECEPVALAVPAAVFVAVLGVARARLPHRRAMRSATAGMGALALVLAGGVGLRTASRPEIHRVPTQPVLAVLPAIGQESGRGAPTRSARFVDQPVPGTDLLVRRHDFGDGRACALRVARGEGRASLPTSVVPADRTDEPLLGCGALQLQRDPSHGVIIVSSTSWYWSTRAVFDARDGAPWSPARAVYATWARESAAPWSWLIAAMLALLTAAVAVLRPVETRWWAARSRWREGALGEDGVITMTGDGSRVVAPFGAALPQGPVVLRALASGDDSPFRGTARVDAVSRDDVRSGTAASVAVSLESEADARVAFALLATMIAVATLAPLWAMGFAN